MRKYYFLIAFVTSLLLNITGVNAQAGYIIKVDENKIYLNMPNAKVSDIVSALDNGSFMTDPRTGDSIYIEPEIVGQIKIIAVQSNYAVGLVYGDAASHLAEGMTVKNGTVMQKNSYGETTVMIAPAELNFPQGVNTMVGDGYIGDYVSAALMSHLLQSDKIQLIDRSALAMQQNEISLGKSGEIDYNTALEYGKISGVRYVVKITLQKPDVVNVGNSIPVKGIMDAVEEVTKSNKTGRDGTERTNRTRDMIPSNMQTNNVKVSVRIVTHIIDLQTGKVLFTTNSTGTASGNPQISLESTQYGHVTINSKDVNFTQTVTGKAIDNAFKKIGKELNKYFSKNL